MARTKGVNKTPAVRAYISKNPTATAQEVVDGLKAEGMEVTTSLVYNVKATGKKKWAAKRAMKKAVAPAASTNGSTGTKADAIRAVASGMEKPVRPRDVVAALKEQGMDVNRTQVGQVLAKMGMRKRRRRRKAAGSAARAVASNSSSINIDDLIAAKKLVAHVGSIERVKEALSALARLN